MKTRRTTAYSRQREPEGARRVQRENATYNRAIESNIPIIATPPFEKFVFLR
jgi:hypothetical protein